MPILLYPICGFYARECKHFGFGATAGYFVHIVNGKDRGIELYTIIRNCAKLVSEGDRLVPKLLWPVGLLPAPVK